MPDLDSNKLYFWQDTRLCSNKLVIQDSQRTFSVTERPVHYELLLELSENCEYFNIVAIHHRARYSQPRSNHLIVD